MNWVVKVCANLLFLSLFSAGAVASSGVHGYGSTSQGDRVSQSKPLAFGSFHYKNKRYYACFQLQRRGRLHPHYRGVQAIKLACVGEGKYRIDYQHTHPKLAKNHHRAKQHCRRKGATHYRVFDHRDTLKWWMKNYCDKVIYRRW